MKRHWRSYPLIVAIPAVIYGFLVTVSPEVWFSDAQENYYRSFWREHRKIAERESIAEFLTFDEPPLPEYSDGSCRKDWYAITDLAASRVVKANGRHGKGLKFDGDNDTFCAFDYAWNNIPEAFSIAFWLKLNPMPRSQDILCTWDPEQMGFWLDRGALRFDWPGHSSTESISYEFGKYKEFVHIAVVADRRKGYIRLYENGVPKAEGSCRDLESFRWQFTLGKGSFARNRNPLHGTIDDLAIWQRAISEDELRDIVTSPYDIQDHYSTPKMRFSMKKKRLRAAFLEKLGGLISARPFGTLNPPSPHKSAQTVESVSIYLRDPSWRSQARAHARSARSGNTVAHAPVEAFVNMGGKTMQCRLSLAGGTMYYPYTKRQAYVVEPLDGDATFPNGYRRIELLPPEKSGWIVPLATSEIRRRIDMGPALRKDCDAVMLRINGMRRGLFLMRDASHCGASQDIRQNVWEYSSSVQPFVQQAAEREALSPATFDVATSNLVAMLSSEEKASVLEKLEDVAARMANDGYSPVPAALRAKAILASFGKCRDVIAESTLSGVDDVVILPSMFISSNLCPWCVTGDLDLSGFAKRLPDGMSVSYASSNTNLMSHSGKVTRPGSRPEPVTLTATIASETGARRQVPLEFRLLPLTNAVSAVFVWTQIPFGRTHRTDGSIEIVEFDGTNGPVRLFDGPAAVRYRGNSSFLRSKKLINVKTDSPHHWLGQTETTHLLAIDAVTDVLRVWNRLAYDLYRDFPRADGIANISPHVKVAELFVNGRYWSMIEFAERLDEHLWGDDEYVAYRHRIASPRRPFMRQSHPDVAKVDELDRYLDFEKTLSEYDRNKCSIKDVESQLDMTSVVDYTILLSLFANINGGDGDFWAHECLVYNTDTRKYFYVPWDFDVLMLREPGIQETNLNRLLSAEDPAYDELVFQRWQALRKTVLATDAVLARYDDIISRHAAYLPFEHDAWYRDDGQLPDIRTMIRNGRANMAYRLEKMDRLFSERRKATTDGKQDGR